MIVTMTKNRMDKLNQFGGGPIPIRVKGAGKSGEFTAVMMPKNSGGMLVSRGDAEWWHELAKRCKEGIRGCVAVCDAGWAGDGSG